MPKAEALHGYAKLSAGTCVRVLRGKAKVVQNSINIHRPCLSVRPSVRPVMSCFHLSSTKRDLAIPIAVPVGCLL